MAFSETLVINDGTVDKSYVTIVRNGKSTTRRSSAADDPATEPQQLTIANSDIIRKNGHKSSRSLVQCTKTKLQSGTLAPKPSTVNVTLDINQEGGFTDADVAELLLTAFRAAAGSALTTASATATIARLRLGES